MYKQSAVCHVRSQTASCVFVTISYVNINKFVSSAVDVIVMAALHAITVFGERVVQSSFPCNCNSHSMTSAYRSRILNVIF